MAISRDIDIAHIIKYTLLVSFFLIRKRIINKSKNIIHHASKMPVKIYKSILQRYQTSAHLNPNKRSYIQ